MNLPQRRWYKRIIPCMLIFCLLSKQITASPDCPIIAANFSGLSEGTTVNNSTTGWYLNAANVASSAIFWVKSNRFHAQELGGEGVWYSKVFSVAGYTDFQIATKITAEGDMNSTEYVKVYYKINGGAEILLDQRTGNFGTVDFVSPLLNGSNVQFVIRIYNYNNGGTQTSKYYIEDYRVFKEHGPCAGGIPVTASAGSGGILTCTNTSLTLAANSTATGVTYSWTGPGSFTSTAQNPVITTAGTYNVVATNSTGSGSASVIVTENKVLPGVTATGASLGCATSVTISATSPVAGVQYAWTGPGSFTSTAQNPVVSTAGTYTVKVTNPTNGCFTTQQVQVTTGTATSSVYWLEDFTFANGTVADTGTTPWTLENTAAGTFSVQTNELMASFTAANEGTWKSGVIDISTKTNSIFTINLRSGTAGSGDAFEDDDYIKVYYKLNGGAETLLYSDISGLKGTTTGTANDTVTSPVLNGSTIQIIVRFRNSNATERYYMDNVKLTGYNAGTAPLSATVSDTLTCTNDSVTLAGSSTTAGVSYSWTGPNGYTAATQNAIATAPGVYTLTVSSGGCTSAASVTVYQRTTPPAGVQVTLVSPTNTLTCTVNHVVVVASSTTPGAYYSWTGPNGYTSSSPGITAFNAGVYTATVYNPESGCTATASYTVKENRVFPGANVNPNLAMLTCYTPSVLITGSAEATTVKYSWSGPDGITGTDSTILAIAPGPYYLLVTDSVNGCTTSTTATILEDRSIPVTPTIAASANALTCINSSIILTGSSASTGLNYSWQGPGGFSSPSAFVQASVAGQYNLTVSYTSNGCFATAAYIVIQDTAAPQGVGITPVPASAMLTCTITSVMLNAHSSTPGVTYSWSGPTGFTSQVASPSVNTPGQYQVTITNPANGCARSATATVTLNSAPPAGVSAFSSAKLTCFTPAVTISGTSSTTGALFSWTGPNGFIATTQNASVAVPGSYQLKVTNPENGCISNAVANVQQDTTSPDISVSNTGPLTCEVFEVEIHGVSATPDVDYTWSGPDGFSSNAPDEFVYAPGNYMLTVLDLNNGCTATRTTVVEADYTGCQRSITSANKTVNSQPEATQVPTEKTGQFEYKAYPNPFSNKVNVEFKAPQTAPVNISIYNAAGMLKKVLYNNTAQAGQWYKLPMDATAFPAGAYYCIIRINEKVYTIKLITVKK